MIIDLFSGQGRFPGDDVIRIDSNPKTKPTIIADVRWLPLRPGLRPKLVHMSPPCKYFSISRKRNLPGIAESLRLVAAGLDATAYLQAENWTMENPQGLLSRILPGDMKIEYAVEDMKGKRSIFWASDSRALRRAMLPLGVREAITESVLQRRRRSSLSVRGVRHAE